MTTSQWTLTRPRRLAPRPRHRTLPFIPERASEESRRARTSPAGGSVLHPGRRLRPFPWDFHCHVGHSVRGSNPARHLREGGLP